MCPDAAGIQYTRHATSNRVLLHLACMLVLSHWGSNMPCGVGIEGHAVECKRRKIRHTRGQIRRYKPYFNCNKLTWNSLKLSCSSDRRSITPACSYLVYWACNALIRPPIALVLLINLHFHVMGAYNCRMQLWITACLQCIAVAACVTLLDATHSCIINIYCAMLLRLDETSCCCLQAAGVKYEQFENQQLNIL